MGGRRLFSFAGALPRLTVVVSELAFNFAKPNIPPVTAIEGLLDRGSDAVLEISNDELSESASEHRESGHGRVDVISSQIEVVGQCVHTAAL